VIVTAQGLLAAGPADVLTMATENVRHFSWFADAQPWEKIIP
jgi:hypothetical protein